MDQIWVDRPEGNTDPVEVHSVEYAGLTVAEKLSQVGAKLLNDGYRGLVVTRLDSIAWILNMRGKDVPHRKSVRA